MSHLTERDYLSALFVPTLFFNLAYSTASWIVSRISSIFLIRFCSFLVFFEFLLSPTISLANWDKARAIALESTDKVLANFLPINQKLQQPHESVPIL